MTEVFRAFFLFIYVVEIKIFEVILTGLVFYSLQQQ